MQEKKPNQDMMEITNNLYKFYYFIVTNLLYKKSEHAMHILRISKELEKMAVGIGNNRLCVSVPPQHSKSSLITLSFPIWLIIHNPNLRIMIVNSEADLSRRFGLQLRELAAQILPFFGLTLSKKKQSVTEFMFEKDGRLQRGNISLTGVGGGITGRPADYLIIDDPYKGFTDITPTYLQKRKDWFQTIIEPRLRKETKLLILHTRWHSEDIIGFLKENYSDDYTFLSYPAIDENNNPLWHINSLDWYMKKKENMGERMFAAQYQQQPLDLTSKFFIMENWKWENSFEGKYEDIVRAWDIAYDEDNPDNQNAYTVGVLMARVNSRSYWILDYVRGRFGEKTINKVRQVAKQDGKGVPILIETGSDGGAAEALFKMWKKQLSGFYVRQAKTHNKSKPDRDYPLSGAVYDGYIHSSLKNIDDRIYLEKEFNSFPNGKFKDLVDASAHAFNYLNTVNDEILYGVS